MSNIIILHKVVADEFSETHNFSLDEAGNLTIRDLNSLLEGNEEHPEEFVRLNQHSVRVLLRMLFEANVQGILAPQ